MRSLSLPGLLALCACLWCTHARAEDAAPTRNERYAQLLKQGVEAFTQGQWQEAREAFERAHAIDPTARTYRGLALCDFELGNYARSARLLEAALRDPRRPLTPELRVQVLRTLERALRDAGRVHLVVPEDVTELRVDGNLESLPEGGMLLLDPGPHTLELVHEGREPIIRQLEVQNGASQNLIIASVSTRQEPDALQPTAAEAPAPALALQPTAAEATPRIWSWVALGLTGAVGAGTLALAVATREKHAQFSEQREAYAARLAAGEGGRPPSAGLKESGQRLELLTNVGLVGCGVLGVATVALFVFEKPGLEKAVQVRAGLGPGGLSLHGEF